MPLTPSQLILQNGARFEGLSPAWQKQIFEGEVVFTTGMTGYVESLTDPSYKGQIITFTYPLIGNYGVPAPKTWESTKIHASGVVVSEACVHWSHSDGQNSLLEWLKAQKVPIITGVDTRALTKILRETGVMLGAIAPVKSNVKKFHDPNVNNLVAQVSITKPTVHESQMKKSLPRTDTRSGSGARVVVVDCGMKANILRELKKYPLTLKQVPFDYDYSNENFDAIFISNGPGDPAMCKRTIAILKKALEHQKPIFGICLGLQLMTLAAGGKTYKLPYGHRGQNQPCMETKTGQCFVTSQNHGFAADAKSLPAGWKVSFTNLNDGSVEGIEHKTNPYFAVQFHPEAAPGPTDMDWLFEKFYQSILSS
ncbi:MAG: glutamine-hydrolyzing carbamoyl-phosphate synthase small subunit [Candidatus Magasanikbacteria bacterium]|jgi:carbamoyl-phosphate synthase small subunit